MPSNHLILCHPLLLLPSIFSSIRNFSKDSVLCIRWPKYSSFSFSISPSNEHSGLISFRMDWVDLLEVQGTLKSLLQHHSSKAQSCPTLCDPMNHSMTGLPVHHQLLEFTQLMSIDSVMASSHLILCHPLLLLPPIPPSIRVFSNESTLCMR